MQGIIAKSRGIISKNGRGIQPQWAELIVAPGLVPRYSALTNDKYVMENYVYARVRRYRFLFSTHTPQPPAAGFFMPEWIIFRQNPCAVQIYSAPLQRLHTLARFFAPWGHRLIVHCETGNYFFAPMSPHTHFCL